MAFSLSEKSKNRREGVDPRLIEISDLAIQITLVDFGHPQDGGVRTAERQNQLCKNGKSKCDGYEKLSNHQVAPGDTYGKALDVYAFVGGKASWEYEHLAMVACAFFQAACELGYRIKWGGLWKSKNPKISNGIPYGWDCPHIELLDDD